MNNKDKGNVGIGIGLVFLVLGLTQIAYPSGGRPTGRWSFMLSPIFDTFGQLGPSIIYIGLGVLLVIVGFSLRSKK